MYQLVIWRAGDGRCGDNGEVLHRGTPTESVQEAYEELLASHLKYLTCGGLNPIFIDRFDGHDGPFMHRTYLSSLEYDRKH